MINQTDTIEMLKISSKIIDIFDQKNKMPNGDFQACLEAQVMTAYLLGQKRCLADWKKSTDEIFKK